MSVVRTSTTTTTITVISPTTSTTVTTAVITSRREFREVETTTMGEFGKGIEGKESDPPAHLDPKGFDWG